MSRLQSWIFVSLALVIFPLDGPGFGATRPTAAQRCAAAKIAAAVKKSRADLVCRAKGALAGGPPDSACLLKAQQAFDAALSRADRRGGCVAPGDAGNVAAAIDRGIADLAADATGQCTAGCVEGCSGSLRVGVGAFRDPPATDRQDKSGHCEPGDETGLRGHERVVGRCDVGAYQTPPG